MKKHINAGTLVIMAAGIGSRFGGSKQLEAVDEAGRALMDYSIYDAARSGFDRVIFVIKEENKELFEKRYLHRSKEGKMKFELVFQRNDDLPFTFSLPEGRKKPWGTAHAIACLEGKIDSSFAVINADDFYGREAFFLAGRHIGMETEDCLAVTYRLKNTLSKFGSVSRGICTESEGYLEKIEETYGIEERMGIITSGSGKSLSGEERVSMNFWVLTPWVVLECKRRFVDFLRKNLGENPLKSEYFLPRVLSELIAEKNIKIRLSESSDEWYGMTYKEDKKAVFSALEALRKRGDYPGDF